MLYLTADELTANILSQSEKAAAVIGSIDFKKTGFDHNTVIIPFLGNIFDSALTVLALESGCGTENQCYREPKRIVLSACCLSREMGRYMADISDMRAEYDGFGGSSGFDLEKCLLFLTNYCGFMSGFLEKSSSARRLCEHKDIICGFAETVAEKAEKKQTTQPQKPEDKDDNIADLLRRLIKETQRTNELLEQLLR
ncbi:MAG: hypothetical protein NC093_07840 [Alistipes sp.]|nr:hypothetical protein [Alistipes sp.]